MVKTKIEVVSLIFILESQQEIEDFLRRISSFNKDIKSSLSANVKIEYIIIFNFAPVEDSKALLNIKKSIGIVRLIFLSKKNLVDNAIMAGLEASIGERIFVLNYLNYYKGLFSKLYKQLESYDIVIGKSEISKIPIRKKLKIILAFIDKFSKVKLFINFTNIYGFKRRTVDYLLKSKGKKRLISYLSYSMGFIKGYVDIKVDKALIKKFNRQSFFGFLIETIDMLLYNSSKPLRFITFFSSFSAILSFVFILYIFGVAIIKRNVFEGWISTNILIASMFLFLFIVLTLMSEYVIRILEEVRQEPSYFVAKNIDNSVIISEEELLNIEDKV